VSLTWTIVLITAATAASAAIGFLVSASLLGLAAGLPTLIVGVWQAWRHQQQMNSLVERVTDLEPTIFDQLDKLSQTGRSWE
jgi:hypothetical protein